MQNVMDNELLFLYNWLYLFHVIPRGTHGIHCWLQHQLNHLLPHTLACQSCLDPFAGHATPQKYYRSSIINRNSVRRYKCHASSGLHIRAIPKKMYNWSNFFYWSINLLLSSVLLSSFTKLNKNDWLGCLSLPVTCFGSVHGYDRAQF